MNDEEYGKIVEFVQRFRGMDLSAYNQSILRQRILEQMGKAGISHVSDFLIYLSENPSGMNDLINSFTIKVSEFFRDPLVFEMLYSRILPRLIYEKNGSDNQFFRVWSAGCAYGEEAYSLSVLFKELFTEEQFKTSVRIFATDLDENALSVGEKGIYPVGKISNVRYGRIEDFFEVKEGMAIVKPIIKTVVNFSHYDLLNRNSSSPPESIFGEFDIVLCRNVLFYFNTQQQSYIMGKIYRSLKPGGILMLGEAEVPVYEYADKFTRVTKTCKIYSKD